MSSIKRPIKIFARLKPLQVDAFNYEIDPVNNDDSNDEILTLCCKQNNEDYYTSNKPETYRFRFQSILDRITKQEDVFDSVAKPVVDSALQGYNGTIFAYGQTGSGKTFTMTGSRSVYKDRGIIPRALSYVFQKFQESIEGSVIQGAFVSYLEIYNENGYDLLQSDICQGNLEDLGRVTLMEDGNQQIHLKNLTVHPIKTEEEALQLLYLGDHNRTIAETPMNEASTRSHCIFTIHLNLRDTESSVVRRSKIHLVDLAGSERIGNTNISGQLLVEARHINLALHYLEQVIVALSESNRTHIPYRNSMMTSILRDSLGGNCMTSMIATLSLEPKNLQESLSTCRFSQRVALVTNAAVLNEEVDPNILISQLKAEVKRLRELVATSVVKPLKEDAEPLTEEEVCDCSKLVERFLKDTEVNAVLPVVPDMRRIQACFRLLKMAVETSKGTSTLKAMKYSLPLSCSNSKQAELIKTIQERDREINVLVGNLKLEKEKRYRDQFGVLAGNRKQVDDMMASNSPKNKSLSDWNENFDEETSRPRSLSQGDSFFDSIVDNDDEWNYSKKKALEKFISKYPGKEKLSKIQDNLMKKKKEIQQIEEQMNKSHENMKTLQDAIDDSEEKAQENYLNLAVESQKTTIQMQEDRLVDVKKQMEETHGVLKTVYRNCIKEFNEWWKRMGINEFSKPLTTSEERNEADESKIEPHRLSDVSSIAKKPAEVEAKTRKNKSSRPSTSVKSVRWSDLYEDTIKSPKTPLSPKSSGRRDQAFMSKPSKNENLRWIPNQFSPAPSPPPSTPMSKSSNDSDEDIDKEELRNLPRTGDPETDNEILAFFKARQKILKQLSLKPDACDSDHASVSSQMT